MSEPRGPENERPDDELGAFLRDEVPEPGAGYWDRIDASLAAAGNPRVDGAVSREKIPVDRETDAEVIRLTNMNETSKSEPAPAYVWILGAAAALLLVVVGGAFLLSQAIGDGDEIVAGSDDAASTDDGASAVPTSAAVPPTVGVTTVPPVLTPPPPDTAPPPAPTAAPASTGATVPADAVVFLEDATPMIYGVVGDVDARLAPGVGAGVFATFAEGDIRFASTGRRAAADGFEWVELEGNEERPRLWLPTESVVQLDQNHVCYSGFDVVIVIGFDEAADTFTGGVRTLFEGNFTYEAVAGRRQVDIPTGFDVNTQAEGADVMAEVWVALADGMSVNRPTFAGVVPAVPCPSVLLDFVNVSINPLRPPSIPEP